MSGDRVNSRRAFNVSVSSCGGESSHRKMWRHTRLKTFKINTGWAKLSDTTLHFCL